MAFLQLGTTRAHRSVLKPAKLLQMSKEEKLFTTTASTAAPTVDETIHRYNMIMTTTCEEELHVWAYIMTQYNLSREEKMKALSSLLFLKEKRTVDIKGRACINGAPQRSYIAKEEAASPTISMESTFITTSIVVHERQFVRCYNIPSAFVNTDVDEDVIMVLKGDLVEIMIQVAPEVY